MTKYDYEPVCGEIGCEAPDVPLECRHAECVYCGKDLRRTRDNKWVPWYMDDEGNLPKGAA